VLDATGGGLVTGDPRSRYAGFSPYPLIIGEAWIASRLDASPMEDAKRSEEDAEASARESSDNASRHAVGDAAQKDGRDPAEHNGADYGEDVRVGCDFDFLRHDFSPLSFPERRVLSLIQ
jgi:hypothetical protein